MHDMITLCLSIFGALGTIGTWIVSAIRSRKSLDVQILKACQLDQFFILYICILNKSRLPISIGNIFLIHNGKKYSCVNTPPRYWVIHSVSGKTVTASHTSSDMPFPINLSSLGGTSGYLSFELPEDIFQNFSTPLTFEFLTNRGTLSEMKLSLGSLSDWEKTL